MEERSISHERPRLAVLISGSGSNLQAIIDAIESGQIAATVEIVISNRPGVGGLEKAKRAGIATEVIDNQRYDDRESFDRALVVALQSAQPDLIILAGFMRILTPVFIAPFQGKLLNIHPSLLP